MEDALKSIVINGVKQARVKSCSVTLHGLSSPTVSITYIPITGTIVNDEKGISFRTKGK